MMTWYAGDSYVEAVASKNGFAATISTSHGFRRTVSSVEELVLEIGKGAETVQELLTAAGWENGHA